MVAWDNSNNYFIEVDNDNQQHTKERVRPSKKLAKTQTKRKQLKP